MSESKKNIAHRIEIPQKKLCFFVIFSGISISVAKSLCLLGKHYSPFSKLVIIIIIDLLDFTNPVLSCSSCLNSCVT